MEFKEATITIVGNPTGPQGDHSEIVGAIGSDKTQKATGTVIQGAQNSSGEQLQLLIKQMEELAVGMAAIQREMRQITGQPTPSVEEPKWRFELRRPTGAR